MNWFKLREITKADHMDELQIALREHLGRVLRRHPDIVVQLELRFFNPDRAIGLYAYPFRDVDDFFRQRQMYHVKEADDLSIAALRLMEKDPDWKKILAMAAQRPRRPFIHVLVEYPDVREKERAKPSANKPAKRLPPPRTGSD